MLKSVKFLIIFEETDILDFSPIREPGCSWYSEYATCWTVWGSNPHSGKKFFSSPKRPDWLWGPPSLLFNGYRGSLSGVKRPGREVNDSPPCSAEIKNEWSYTSIPPTCLHGLDRKNSH
jgi:hypothetical protein